ncbi:class I tRNA ligase family protein [Candidatus Vidania fulgoroideorum]
MRNWNISRQRYWGTPIPIIKCNKCGIITNKNLPVILPLNLKTKNNNPLKKNINFLKEKCIFCKKKSIKETETLDTFFDSSWYYIYYYIKNGKNIIDFKPIKYYIGGIEHSLLHLLYSRIFCIILKLIGLIKYNFPFKKILFQGLVLNKSFYFFKKNKKIWIEEGKIKGKNVIFNGITKMSKSKKNGISPKKYIKKWGADALRMYIVFVAPIDKNIIWNDLKISGCYRFIKKIWNFFNKFYKIKKIDTFNEKIINLENDIKYCYKNMKFNIIVSKLMTILNEFKKENVFNMVSILRFLRNLYPISPFISSFIWIILGFKKKYGYINKFNV